MHLLRMASGEGLLSSGLGWDPTRNKQLLGALEMQWIMDALAVSTAIDFTSESPVRVSARGTSVNFG
eukprot:COSAG01_NODE_35303_length_534_cov_0.489655_2_plen_66_part_01